VNTLLGDDAGALGIDSLQTLLREGRHPAAGRPFAKVGSLVAAMLKRNKGTRYIEAAHGRGVLAMYADYCDLAAKTFNLERFDADFEETVMVWNKAWIRSWNDDVRALHFSSDVDIDEARLIMRRAVQNQPIYPDLMDDIKDACFESLREGKDQKALELALMGVDLYPHSDVSNATMGILHVVRGDVAEGREYIARAIDWDPDGAASTGGLNSMAYRLAGRKQYDQAIDVLTVAIEYYPDVANLYDSKAEMYLNKGDLAASRQWYEKALEIDPSLDHPRQMLQRIDQMEAEQPAGSR